jgi:hypothetical protein
MDSDFNWYIEVDIIHSNIIAILQEQKTKFKAELQNSFKWRLYPATSMDLE